MKKLSLNASAFQKGEVLTRSQLKKVLGGNSSGSCEGPGLCRVMYYDSSHTYQETDILGGSAEANAACLSKIAAGATRCWYDCDCDGWGS